MNTLLEGRTIIVTGAARGIGQAYCKALNEAGAAVVAADILELDETLALLGEKGVGARLDVTDMASCQAMVSTAEKAYGRVDGIINNAAIYGPSKLSEGARVSAFDEISEESWQRMFNVNVAGMWRCCKAVAPVMRKQGYGKIVNIGSTSVALGAANLLHYVASKGAVLAMTRVLARELGPHGIRVNTLAPGFTQSQASKDILREGHIEFLTDVIKANCALGREQAADDLVGTAVYLLSSLSDFVTGQVLAPDGGVSFTSL